MNSAEANTHASNTTPFLLVWTSRKPVERKGVILLTVVPVLAGLAGASAVAVQSGFTQAAYMLPLWIFHAWMIPLYAMAYRAASGIEKASANPATQNRLAIR